MKLFVITALLLPAICLAKTASMDDMLAQLLMMKASGTKNQAGAEYTYDESKGAVVSILELVKEMVGDQASALKTLVGGIATAQASKDEADKAVLEKKTAKKTANDAVSDAQDDLDTATTEQGKEETKLKTLTQEHAGKKEAAKKADAALAGIVSFLCKKTTNATEALCAELDPASGTASVTPEPSALDANGCAPNVHVVPKETYDYKREKKTRRGSSDQYRLEVMCTSKYQGPFVWNGQILTPQSCGEAKLRSAVSLEKKDLKDEADRCAHCRACCDASEQCKGFTCSSDLSFSHEGQTMCSFAKTASLSKTINPHIDFYTKGAPKALV